MQNDRNYLYQRPDGRHMTLNEWINPNNAPSKEDKLSLLSDKESHANAWISFDKSDVRSRVYFYDVQQYYGSYNINESYGYKPFREANPDLNDCHGTHFGRSKYLKKKLDEMDIKCEEWKAKRDNLSNKDQWSVREEDNPYGFEARRKFVHDYNIKKNGWSFCKTHMGLFYLVEVDAFDDKLLSIPTCITQEEIDAIQKLAPYTNKWSEFGVIQGDDLYTRWFDKSKLPARAYKNNSYKARAYKNKQSILKAMEVK